MSATTLGVGGAIRLPPRKHSFSTFFHTAGASAAQSGLQSLTGSGRHRHAVPISCGASAGFSRRSHKPSHAGSIPAPATTFQGLPRPAVCKTVVIPKTGSRQVERYHQPLPVSGAVAQPRRAAACRAEGRGSKARLRRHFLKFFGRLMKQPDMPRSKRGALRGVQVEILRRPPRSRSSTPERDSSNVEDAGVIPAGSAISPP